MFGRKKEKSKIVVHYDAGFPNHLYLRGEGIPGLNWQKGVKMKNVGANEWELELKESFRNGKFKVLINDQIYEQGEDHPLKSGQLANVYPQFEKRNFY